MPRPAEVFPPEADEEDADPYHEVSEAEIDLKMKKWRFDVARFDYLTRQRAAVQAAKAGGRA